MTHNRLPAANQDALVLLNFSDQDQSISVHFPTPGVYRKMIDNDVRPAPFEITVNAANQMATVDVPPNYGYIFVT